jgi:hypothetical protein
VRSSSPGPSVPRCSPNLSIFAQVHLSPESKRQRTLKLRELRTLLFLFASRISSSSSLFRNRNPFYTPLRLITHTLSRTTALSGPDSHHLPGTVI